MSGATVVGEASCAQLPVGGPIGFVLPVFLALLGVSVFKAIKAPGRTDESCGERAPFLAASYLTAYD